MIVSGLCKKFATNRIEMAQGLCWNSIFGYADLMDDEAASCQLSLSLWQDCYQCEIKLGYYLHFYIFTFLHFIFITLTNL